MSPPTSRASGTGFDPSVEGAIVVGAVTVAGGLYLAGVAATEISSRVAGGGGAGMSWTGHARSLIRLPWHLSDPRDAYPELVRDRLAGPVGWWTTATLIVVVLIAVVGCAVRVLLARRDRGWARPGDLRALRPVRGEHRVILGTHHRRAVTVEERHSALAIGATQSYKTTGLAVPAILEADDLAVIALSVKDDLMSDTIGWRSTLAGRHWVFDPTSVLRLDDVTRASSSDDARRLAIRQRIVTAGWSPLDSSRTWQGALATAFDLTRAGGSAHSGADGDNKFFYESAETLIACYLYAAANTPGSSMRTVVRWVAQHAKDEVETRLVGLDSQEAFGHFCGVFEDDRKTLANIFSTARLLIAAWLDPSVADSADRCDITPAAFFDGQPNTLYVLAPPSNQDRLRVVFNLLVKQLTDHAYLVSTRRGRPLDRRVLIVIDELANIAPIPNLANLASTAAAIGIQLVSILQDVSQLRSRYGADDAGTIVNNHRAMLLLAGSKDLATLELTSKLLGNRDRTRTSTTRDLWGRQTSRTDSTHETPLAPVEQLRQQPRGSGVLLYGGLAGAELRMRPWFDDRTLRHKARHIPAGNGPINPLSTADTTTERTPERTTR
jgi:type IV secretory pathway TraG/TraD family ATPase VirD4